MDQRRLTELLHLQPEEISEPTSFCPDGHELAALLDGKTERPGQERLERHLAECGYCRARSAVSARLGRGEDHTPIPDDLLAAADRMGEQPPSRRFRHPARWAAAAAFVIVLGAALIQAPRNAAGPEGSPESISGEQMRRIRNIDAAYQGPVVLTPSEGSTVHAGELAVRWTEVPGSLYYDVRLVDAQGFLLWQDRVRGTSAVLSTQTDLLSGERYFVRVDAYLAEAKSVSSSHVRFNYKERD